MVLLEAKPGSAGEADSAELRSRGLESPELTWLEHLTELRRRVLICLGALVIGTVAAWFFYDHLLDFMIGPYRHYLLRHPEQDISKGNLVVTGPLEGFTTRLKVSAYAGAILAGPVFIWQAWRFVVPALYRHERRRTLAFTTAAIALFGLGVVTAVAVFPKAIDWMISVAGSGTVPLFSPSRYLGLYVAVCGVFGGVFTYPVFLVALEMVGVVTSSALRRGRRYAIVACCAIAAVITPSSDPFSFLALAVPMVVFYEAAIVSGRILGK
jgi:sec-independent protein translocase protein TatC